MTVLEPIAGTVGFAADLRAHGDRVALVVPGGPTVTYAELADRADEVARRLGPVRRLVAVRLANDLGSVVAYLGALRGGHPVLALPADPAAGAAIADAWMPDAVLTGTGTDDDDRPGDERHDDAHGWHLDERHDGTAHDLHPDLALLLSTSGSTGAAKLVRLSSVNLEANAEAIAEYLGIGPADRAATSLPLHYCYGLSVLHSHLARGASLVLTGRSVAEPAFWDEAAEHRVTSFAGVPYTFDLLDRVGFADLDLPQLRYVTQAGGRLAPDRVRRFAELGRRRGWDLVVMYGQTEATARMAYLPPDLAAERPESIGVPIPGGTLTIDAPDEDGVGELVYRGLNVMLGYAEHPDDLALGRTAEELRTGDLGRQADDGLFAVVGRTSRFVKPYGLRVDLDRLEHLLIEDGHPVLVTGTDDGLVIATTAGDAEARNQLVASVTERSGLPVSAVRVCTVDALPRLATGKPDHAALLTIANAADAGAPDADATDDATIDVAALYAAVLGGPITDEDTFVGLGGDSLSYVELSISLERALGDVPEDWPTRTVAELQARQPRRRRLRALETGIVLRAIAIVMVVDSHIGLVDVKGGAYVLLAVAGHNFARFRLSDPPVRRWAWLSTVGRIAVPSMLYIGVLFLLRDGFSPWNVALLNNYLTDGRWRYWYWYVEVITQLLLVAGAASAVPALRRLERRCPFGVALAAYALVWPLRHVLHGEPENQLFVTHAVAWLFVLGWVVQRATTVRRKLVVTALVLASVPGFFTEPERPVVVVAGTLLLLWVPHVRLPRGLAAAAGALAGASLYIYLAHWRVFGFLQDNGFDDPVQFAASFAVGLTVHRAVQALTRRVFPAARRAVGERLAKGRERPADTSSTGQPALLR